ncbi:MAG: GTPase HflX, partial [Candidatus Binatia bacterium]
MKHLISTQQPKEKALLVGVELPSRQRHVPLGYSLEELERLVKTAGATVLGKHTQQVRNVTPATLIGRGKVDEIQASIKQLDANLVIVDEDLT